MRWTTIIIAGMAAAACALFDPDENSPPPDAIPDVLLSASCTDLWQHYGDELQLVTDDQANWQAHDNKALQYSARFVDACNAADMREEAATDLRCKALWGVYVKEVEHMTKEEGTWREHDAQQAEAMNRIRTNCAKTACAFMPGIRCRVMKTPS